MGLEKRPLLSGERLIQLDFHKDIVEQKIDLIAIFEHITRVALFDLQIDQVFEHRALVPEPRRQVPNAHVPGVHFLRRPESLIQLAAPFDGINQVGLQEVSHIAAHRIDADAEDVGDPIGGELLSNPLHQEAEKIAHQGHIPEPVEGDDVFVEDAVDQLGQIDDIAGEDIFRKPPRFQDIP